MATAPTKKSKIKTTTTISHSWTVPNQGVISLVLPNVEGDADEAVRAALTDALRQLDSDDED